MPPLPLQTTAFIALSLTLSREPEAADPSLTFSSWSTSLFSDIQDVFWKKDMDDDLTDIICNGLYTCTKLGARNPSLQVYLAVLKGVTAQVREEDPRNDVYYLRPIIQTVNEVSLYIASKIISQAEEPQEGLGLELELWLALRSAALNTTHACLEHSIAALRSGLDDETALRHSGNIALIIFQVAGYLRVLLDEQPAVKFADAEALRAVQPLIETIAGGTLSTKPQFQDSTTKESIKDLVDTYDSMKRGAARNVQTAKLVGNPFQGLYLPDLNNIDISNSRLIRRPWSSRFAGPLFNHFTKSVTTCDLLPEHVPTSRKFMRELAQM
ncbi:hypothetical protein FRC01_010096 [Tulasnella sp. 417]|nr:hypothetical protein FRC01_010096 [Tulasnella sp. 417]